MKHCRILLIDHDDSFSYNLVHLFEETKLCYIEIANFRVTTKKQIDNFDKIVLGPGPGLPQEYPHFEQILNAYSGTKSILGICLGHQAIGQYFGAQLIHLPQVLHGQKVSIYYTNNEDLFAETNNPFDAGLYHSWVLDSATLPEPLISVAQTDNNLLMAFRHCELNIYGLQFHPESYMTPAGKQLIKNWINL